MAHRAVPGIFVLFALTACNAILGMEHARLDDDAGVDPETGGAGGGGANPPPGTGGSGAVPSKECSAPSDDCTQCVESNCASQMTECLAAADCRKSAEVYAKCVSTNCGSTAKCGESLASSSVPAAAALGLCLSACTTQCAKSPAISMCAPYCQCMKDLCPDQFGIELGPSYAKCIETCEGNSEILANVDCRAAHCEYAPDDPTLHCRHAVGMGFCPLPNPDDALVCTSGTPNGYPCHDRTECCSGNCPRQVCVP